ncbi:MAG: MASE3 domain-containing protein [Chloroflexota bacterium]
MSSIENSARNTASGKWVAGLFIVVVLLASYFTSIHNYLLFHSFVELFSVVIAFAIFAIAWNGRRFLDNHYLLFIGIAFLFVGGLDIIHTLAYKGMGVFPGHEPTNLAAQFWIAARYMQALSLLAATLFIRRKLNTGLAFSVYSLITGLLLVSIFYWHNFPTTFIVGTGLTPFKVSSEYVISLILLGSIVLLLRNRTHFGSSMVKPMVVAMAVTIASEMAFTLYTDAYGVANVVGHLLKIVAYYFIYKAIIETSLVRPYDLLFHNLKQREESLAQTASELTEMNVRLTGEITDRQKAQEALYKAHEQSEATVQERTRELREASETMAAERQRFNNALNILPAYLVLLSPDYHVPFANRFFEERFGKSNGKRCFEYLFHRTEPCENCETYTVLKTMQPHYWEWLGPDGRNYDISDFPFTDTDGSTLIMEVGLDITERKKAEAEVLKAHAELERRVEERTRELAESEDKYRSLFDNMTEAFVLGEIISDDDGKPCDFRYIEVNKAWEELTHIPRENAIGKTRRELIPTTEQQRIETYAKVTLTGEPTSFEYYSPFTEKWLRSYVYSPRKGQFAYVLTDITGRKKVEAELTYLATFPELSPNPIVEADAAGRITYMNPSARTVFPDLPAQGISHPFLADWESAIARIRSENLSMLNRDIKVGEAWFTQTVSPVPPEQNFRIYSQDITDRRKAEDNARQLAKEWQSTFDSITDPISIQDRDFKVVRVNKAYEDTIKMSQDDMAGRKCYELIHGTTCPIADCPHQQTLDTRQGSVKEFFEPHLGIYLEASTSPIFDKDGEIIGSVHIAKDITDRRKAERLKDEFIGMVSHELRTPLTVVLGALYTAKTEGVSEEDKGLLLTDAISGAESLGGILENLIELSRSQADRLTLRKEATDIVQVTESILAKLRSKSPIHQITVNLPAKLPSVMADPVRVGRVLHNLVDNAIKYSPQGGRIEVFAEPKGHWLVICVKDYGVGIPSENAAKLFGHFERLDRPSVEGIIPGLGLGLNVCRILVEAHGGHIWVESEPGQGSTFYFTLPIATKADDK